MKLYDAAASGNCHKVRLMLALLGRAYETVAVNLPDQEQKTPAYLAMNPLGQVPVLDDDGYVIRDSQAILVYLARKYGGDDWLPTDAADLGEVMQWLSFSANEMINGAAMARALVKFKRQGDLELAQTKARAALAILDGRLADNDWLALGRPTIADIACYPYAGLVWEGRIDIDAYPALKPWFARIEALPGYVGMDGLGK